MNFTRGVFLGQLENRDWTLDWTGLDWTFFEGGNFSGGGGGGDGFIIFCSL